MTRNRNFLFRFRCQDLNTEELVVYVMTYVGNSQIAQEQVLCLSRGLPWFEDSFLNAELGIILERCREWSTLPLKSKRANDLVESQLSKFKAGQIDNLFKMIMSHVTQRNSAVALSICRGMIMSSVLPLLSIMLKVL